MNPRRLVKIGVSALMLVAVPVSATAGAAEKARSGSESARHAAGCIAALGMNTADRDATVYRLRKLYRSGEFAELDRRLSCLVSSPERLTTGESGAEAVYSMFRRQMPAPGVDPAEAARVARWRRESPESVFAEFAQLRLKYAMAWNHRGTSFASGVPEDGWARFTTLLLEAEQGLLSASPGLRDTPLWHNQLLAVALDTREAKSDAQAVFERGVSRWPGYYHFYELMLSRMVPRWGGTWEAVDRFVNHWSVKRRRVEGDSMYARLYSSVAASGSSPDALLVDWSRMKSSFDDLLGRYTDPVHANIAASWACWKQDQNYFRRAMARVGPDLRLSAWLRGTDPNACRARWGVPEA